MYSLPSPLNLIWYLAYLIRSCSIHVSIPSFNWHFFAPPSVASRDRKMTWSWSQFLGSLYKHGGRDTAVTRHDECAKREINEAWEGTDYKWSNSNTESPASPLHDSNVLSFISTQLRKHATFLKHFPTLAAGPELMAKHCSLKYAVPGWAPSPPNPGLL